MMEWNYPKWRYVKRFALLPIRIENECKWLETVYIEQERHNESLSGALFYVNSDFVTKEEYLENMKEHERKKKTRKEMWKIIIVLLILSAFVACVTGCQSATKHIGGDMTIELESNQKLEGITWKDDDLWYTTRPMREDEEAETHTFQQSTDFGVFEGTVTVVEIKE